MMDEPTEGLAPFRKVSLADAARGPIRFDDYGNPIQNMYVRKVEKVGGKLQNAVIHTFPNVSQFWTYNPAEFLKQPGLPAVQDLQVGRMGLPGEAGGDAAGGLPARRSRMRKAPSAAPSIPPGRDSGWMEDGRRIGRNHRRRCAS